MFSRISRNLDTRPLFFPTPFLSRPFSRKSTFACSLYMEQAAVARLAGDLKESIKIAKMSRSGLEKTDCTEQRLLEEEQLLREVEKKIEKGN